MNQNPLNQKVNFIVSIVFIGAAALLGIVTMLKAAELENPLASYLEAVHSYEEF